MSWSDNCGHTGGCFFYRTLSHTHSYRTLWAYRWEDEDSAERSSLAAFCASAKKPKAAKRVASFLTKRGFSFVASPHDLMSSA